MMGLLKTDEIEELLSQQVVGRIGCCENGIPYILPISYVYDGKALYFHTYEGRKVQIMRHNPQVCFQADMMSSMADWQSVIVWGNYEEVKTKEEREAALKLLVARSLPMISSVTTHLGKHWPFIPEKLNEDIPGIVFKIHITEKTGRFEKNIQSPIISE